jgi:hypothetical protein
MKFGGRTNIIFRCPPRELDNSDFFMVMSTGADIQPCYG